jgi:hypothetical protein
MTMEPMTTIVDLPWWQTQRVTGWFAFRSGYTSLTAPLANSAQVRPSFWARPQQRFVRDFTAIGWQAPLLIRKYAVTFRRIT